MVGDMVGLLDALGIAQTVIAGYDWGAPVAWHAAQLRPDRFRAAIGLSVPFRARGTVRPTSVMPRTDDAVWYQLYFQEPGVAEAELDHNVRTSFRIGRINVSGDAPPRPQPFGMVPLQGGLFARVPPVPPPLPAWLTEADVDYYTNEFTRTGFRGGLNWYRNIDRNWELTADVAERRVQQPALFLTGELDPVRSFMPAEAMHGWVSDLRAQIVVPAAGHWLQQQAPEAVNAALVDFLHGL
jgi:pimeloyl-ACP methyl ester carboxylesterase